jgi:hypothetical protein
MFSVEKPGLCGVILEFTGGILAGHLPTNRVRLRPPARANETGSAGFYIGRLKSRAYGGRGHGPTPFDRSKPGAYRELGTVVLLNRVFGPTKFTARRRDTMTRRNRCRRRYDGRSVPECAGQGVPYDGTTPNRSLMRKRLVSVNQVKTPFNI